ncbi:hypothetical protein FRC01_010368 [Tulasnella sp. 417]|nr:hypothetical protein FRC01_010368 [Tulasnella sp. 417]
MIDGINLPLYNRALTLASNAIRLSSQLEVQYDSGLEKTAIRTSPDPIVTRFRGGISRPGASISVKGVRLDEILLKILGAFACREVDPTVRVHVSRSVDHGDETFVGAQVVLKGFQELYLPLQEFLLEKVSREWLGERAFIYELADLISDDLVFSGGGGEECEMFIVAVKKQAFRAGKVADRLWIAQFAGTCFAGPALRWYEGLDDATQSDWDLLRRALLARYPPSSSESRISNPGAAPPAAPPPPTHPLSISELSISSPAKIGRIRIHPDNAAAGSYVSKTLNPSGHFLTTSVLAQSLEVQVIPCKGPQNVVLMVGTSIVQYSTL